MSEGERVERLALGWRLLLFVVLLAGIVLLVAPVVPDHPATRSIALLVGAVVAGALLLRRDGRSPAALGFHLKRGLAAETAVGVAVGTALGLLAGGAVALTGGVRWTLEGASPVQVVRGVLEGFALFALPAAAEEALFRGYPLQALAEAWGGVVAVVVISVGFALVHLMNPGVTWVATVNIAVAGAFLGFVYLRTGSLWAATGAHLGWNWAHGGLLDLPVSGIDLIDVPGVTAAVTGGPGWLTGGSFGPEGSILATAVLLAGTGWAARTGRLRASRAVVEARPLATIGEIARDAPPLTPEDAGGGGHHGHESG